MKNTGVSALPSGLRQALVLRAVLHPAGRLVGFLPGKFHRVV